MNKVIVFDLDDTLYKEIDFLKSGYKAICESLKLDIYDDMISLYFDNKNVFEEIIYKYNIQISREKLLEIYREHKPNIQLEIEIENVLKYLKRKGYIIGIVTDGRSISQRNKIEALGLTNFLDKIIISEEIGSEKPNLLNFTPFHEYKADQYAYIGDNINKDFYGPNQLGWQTIQLLDDGRNIKRAINQSEKGYLPIKQIRHLEELIDAR
jgi:putative hydrolase of the HAD superfamily